MTTLMAFDEHRSITITAEGGITCDEYFTDVIIPVLVGLGYDYQLVLNTMSEIGAELDADINDIDEVIPT